MRSNSQPLGFGGQFIRMTALQETGTSVNDRQLGAGVLIPLGGYVPRACFMRLH